jgi:hypothetical protein
VRIRADSGVPQATYKVIIELFVGVLSPYLRPGCFGAIRGSAVLFRHPVGDFCRWLRKSGRVRDPALYI